MIPIAFLALILGISILIAAGLGLPLYAFIGSLLYGLLWFLNEAVFLIESFDFGLLNGIHLSLEQTLLIYLSLFFMVLLFLARRFRYFVMTLCLIVIISGIEVSQAYARAHKKEIVFYDVYGHSLIDIRDGYMAELIGDCSIDEKTLNYLVAPDRLSSGLKYEDIRLNCYSQWQTIAGRIEINIYGDKKFMRISERKWDRRHFNQELYADYLILSNNAVRGLEELMDLFSFNCLIIDSSNGLVLAEKLISEGHKLGINIHSTGLGGAFITEFE